MRHCTVRHVTGKPIKFIGVGEKINGLEPFHPDRLASRILGMGDVLTLIGRRFKKGIDEEAAAKNGEKSCKKAKALTSMTLKNKFSRCAIWAAWKT